MTDGRVGRRLDMVSGLDRGRARGWLQRAVEPHSLGRGHVAE